MPSLTLPPEYPPRADLRADISKPLPFIAHPFSSSSSITPAEATSYASALLAAFNDATHAGDAKKLADCFYEGQAYWRDILALTAHWRTFERPGVIAAAWVEMVALRGVRGDVEEMTGNGNGGARFVRASDTLQFIECDISFTTIQPAATCGGKLVLLPVKTTGKETLEWKIWVLRTWIESLGVQAEDEKLLKAPGLELDDLKTIETDVVVVGGGSAGITISARLKALGVESVVIDKNRQAGDNWRSRYDCLKLHVPTSNCEMPYLGYSKELHTPHLLTREELADHLVKYVAEFNLNLLNSAAIQTTTYDTVTKRWTVEIHTPSGRKTIVAKQLIQATGIGAQKPYLPSIADADKYRGISVHSVDYRNAEELAKRGAKSAIVVGSANTAFDIMSDCHRAGLQTTIVARSPTYLFPVQYIFRALALFDQIPLEQADRAMATFPTAVEGELIRALFARLAEAEPDRYTALAKTGFPLIDSRHPDANLQHYLAERAGGHYISFDADVALLAEGKVGVKANVEPAAYTSTGLRFSDGTTVEGDAVVWCTGFADRDVRGVCGDILGGGNGGDGDNGSNGHGNGDSGTAPTKLGPRDIAARVDATWAVDAEGEIRGMYKRHLRMENYWVVGGPLAHQRWGSRALAQQIKLALEGLLLPAYRDTPKVVG